MKFEDNLTIRVGCEKYELILDAEGKKSFVRTMVSHYSKNPMKYGVLDTWCAGHGIEYKRCYSYRRDQGFIWNLWEAIKALRVRLSCDLGRA